MRKRKIFTATIFLLLIVSGFLILFSDFGAFLSAIYRNPKQIGAALPSSIFLANKITRQIVVKDSPIRVLEVGAGTGAFTDKIVKKLTKNDMLDIIEIDPGLCEVLQEKFENYKNVCIHCLSILDWAPDYKYDFIISGLPFNSFGANFVQNVLKKYKDIIKTDGILSYFEYMGTSSARKLFLRGESKVDFLKNVKVRNKFLKNFEFDRDFIILNIPPAYVYHLKINK